MEFEWRHKYKTVQDYYDNEYDEKYYHFDKYQKEVDPEETYEEIENYDANRQRKEFRKCALSFSYFCQKYVKITHPIYGLIPFILYKYQKRVIKDYDSNRFCMISKFRQGGLTTITVVWSIWRCLFKLDETIMVLSKSDREAIASGEVAKTALEELPTWLKPEMSKNNDHQKLFEDTGCKLFFYTPEAARGRSISYLIIDEAAFIPNMEKYWKAMFPTIATGGHCIAISTVNGVGNWYYDFYKGAEKGDNEFHIIDLDYWEHPDYDNEKWFREVRGQLGNNGWRQEVLRDFLGGGDTYIPADILIALTEKCRDIEPVRILFPQWANAIKKVTEDMSTNGALHVWREPIDGREYIMGVDCAEGVGEDGDNSCIQVIDVTTCDQVAEFYSNSIPPNVFAQIVNQIGILYNHAKVVIESMGAGLSVLSRLQHDFGYDNLHMEVQGKREKLGVKMTRTNRPMFLESMQSKLLNEKILVKSRRFVEELKTFVYNKATLKAEASKGFHDDTIIAMALALSIRDGMMRHLPVGVEISKEMTDSFRTEVFEDIKAELMRGAPEDWLAARNKPEDDLDDAPATIGRKFKRRFDAIAKEFGW